MNKVLTYCLSTILIFFLVTGSVHAQVQTGKSYVNITKGTTGGAFEPGDILEIRATIAVGNFATFAITNVRYVDTLPLNVNYVAGSLRILTNEGLVFKSFTDVGGDDQGMYSGLNRTLRLNMGSTVNGGGTVNLGAVVTATTHTAGGNSRIAHNGRPSFYGGVCIMSASYRIQIPAGLSYGTVINLAGGAFRYTQSGSNITTGLNSYSIALSQNIGLCSNSVGASAIIENNGTFGSGTTQNRATSGIVPGYTFGNIAYNFPNDGTYSIINNSSANGSIITSTSLPDTITGNANIRRVHRLWDLMGDHTGATNPATGNGPVAPGTNGGYFVAINSSYANSNAIQQAVSGLCPNTYYEFSAWFKNICKYCSCDSTGDAPYNGIVPNAAFNGPDSSGVSPNLTFTINGIDYYSTGNISYSGNWVKKGFVYVTGPAETSFTVTIRNNAAGGGGNDWAIDDVTLATCTPDLGLVPSGNAQSCYGNQVNVSCLVSSFSPNYTYWQYERSTDNGATWGTTSTLGNATPVANGPNYEYNANFPPFLADSSQHMVSYRIRVASNALNLSSTACSFTGTTTIVVMVNNCMNVLNDNRLALSASIEKGQARLSWTVKTVDDIKYFEVERSFNGTDFYKISRLHSTKDLLQYNYADPYPEAGSRHYRIKSYTSSGSEYSSIVHLKKSTSGNAITSIVNPFRNQITLNYFSQSGSQCHIRIVDQQGSIMYSQPARVVQGNNSLQIRNLDNLSEGTYILSIQSGNDVITRKLVKSSH